jgi:hypothetical protein
MQNTDQRLKEALQKKAKLDADLNRLKGRRDSAKQSLEEVEELCRKKKVDPEGLGDLILRLTEVYEKRVQKMEDSISEMEQKLAPYMEGES